MSAGRNVRGHARGEDILIAEGAGVAPAVRATNVLPARRHAQLTRGTVHVVFTSAHAAKTAARAMELALGNIVVEATRGAEVGRAKC
jgi:hypothetical protein